VRCTKGAILDVTVDIRRGSPMYKKWVAVELSAENKKQLFIPKGFAHGFLTLTDNVEVQYKADEYYAPEYDGNILFNDPEIGVAWGEGEFILSDKDKNAPLLKDRVDLNFVYQGAN
jgi:dTDP-4-dehydrorhamnose 3,5-epimerase